MYISITAKSITKRAVSSKKLVNYLEKENSGKKPEEKEHFFNQTSDKIPASQVITEIDKNTSKLSRKKPRFYSITISPSKHELRSLKNSSEDLRSFTRKIMEDYCKCFNREINGKPVSINDILYFAKVEHQKKYNWKDNSIKENLPFAKKINALKKELKQIEKGKLTGNSSLIRSKIKKLEALAPCRQNGKRIVIGMPKDGPQSHVHIVMSRKDKSNSLSLSPGTPHKSRNITIGGKTVRSGFDRNHFFQRVETAFDRMFSYNRNYVEFYESRKTFKKDPKKYYSHLAKLSPAEKKIALSLIGDRSSNIVAMNLSKKQISFALGIIQKAVDTGIRSSSICY